MSSKINITITNNQTTATNNGIVQLDASLARREANSLIDLLSGLAGGAKVGSMLVDVDSNSAVAASGTLTLSSSVSTDTVAIGGVTLTEVASGASNVQFNHAGTDTLTAVNLVSTINAHPTLSVDVVASNVGAVVTVKSLKVGTLGNYIDLVGSTHITASVAQLSGGTNPVRTAYHFGM
jgi:phage tail sheath gpL-like